MADKRVFTEAEIEQYAEQAEEKARDHFRKGLNCSVRLMDVASYCGT